MTILRSGSSLTTLAPRVVQPSTRSPAKSAVEAARYFVCMVCSCRFDASANAAVSFNGIGRETTRELWGRNFPQPCAGSPVARFRLWRWWHSALGFIGGFRVSCCPAANRIRSIVSVRPGLVVARARLIMRVFAALVATTVATVAKQVHCDHAAAQQHDEPVIKQPLHIVLHFNLFACCWRLIRSRNSAVATIDALMGATLPAAPK